ncbi:MAG: PorV/PorQ family protein [candidate division Zixibacteria bacterium]|nr:PorV/PorQ family protein [candidate division Zixibacteria bacterium]
MTIKKIFLVTGLILLLFTTPIWATNSKVGTTAYPFLKVGVGARASAMGGAFVGLSDDESALYFNPAGLMQLSDKHFITYYNNHISDIQSGFLGYISPYSEKVMLGFSVNYFNYGKIEETDEQGNRLGTFSAGSFSFAFSCARKIKPRLDLGANVKFILENESAQGHSSDALALDLGGFYQHTDERTRLGAVIHNLGFQLKGFAESHKDPLPTVIKLGISHSLKEIPLLVAGDLSVPFDNDIYLSLGGEVTYFKPLFLRLGWTSFGENYKTDSDKDKWAGMSLGFGFHWKKYIFDYAFSSYADLGGVHRITIAGRI